MYLLLTRFGRLAFGSRSEMLPASNKMRPEFSIDGYCTVPIVALCRIQYPHVNQDDNITKRQKLAVS